MLRTIQDFLTRLHLRRSLLWIGALLMLIWVLVFDSHNVMKRIRWHYELAEVNTRNKELTLEIETLEQKLKDVESEEVVEQIAREQYGMRRPGERVYRVEQRKN